MRRSGFLVLTTLLLAAIAGAGPALAQQARVFGTVMDEAGQPVVKAKIVLEPLPDSGGNRTFTLSSRKGTFLIGIVRPGTYHLLLEAPGQALVSVKARALDIGKKEAWAIDGRPKPGTPPTIQLQDGYEATIDLIVGQAVAGATGSGASQMTSDQAVSEAAAMIQKGDCAGAMPQLDAIVAANASSATAHYLRGYCLGSEQKDEPAAAALGRALELNPKFEGAALLRGQILRRLEKPDEALTMFQQELALTQNPQLRSEALIGVGSIYEEQKKDKEAIEVFQQVATLMPSRPEPYLEMAAIHTRLGEPEKAKAVLEQAQKMGASSPEALLNIGISYFNKKDYEKAGEMFRQVLDIPAASPSDQAMAQALNGKLLLRDGKTNEAIAAMEKSLELDPDGSLAAETRDILKAVKKK